MISDGGSTAKRVFLWMAPVLFMGIPVFSRSQPEIKTLEWINDPVSFVDPFIGTAGERSYRHSANTVPGAVMPFGMLNFGPECSYTDDLITTDRARRMKEEGLRIPVSPGGYNYAASRIRGFSLTRLSGTGCLGASGDVPFLPFTGEIHHSPDDDPLDSYYSSAFSHAKEEASPGYYGVELENGVTVRLSATTRSGIAEFTYPADCPARLLVRTSYSQLGSGQAYTRIDTARSEISGSVTSGNFCGYLGEYNRRSYYTLYFVASLDKGICRTGGWEDGSLIGDATEVSGGMGYGEAGIPKTGKGSGVWVECDLNANRTVRMKVGISYVSVENARENLMKEQSDGDSVESVRKRAREAWNRSLSRIGVESADKMLLQTFYTALYHSLFHPNVFSDVNGEYAGFDGNIHRIKESQNAQYANFSGWDVYRSQLQLLSLTHPEVGSDIAQSLLNQATQYGGIWDRWTHNSGPTGVMSGDPANIAIANFVAFGCRDFEVEAAYRSLAGAARKPTEFDLSPVGKPVFSRGQKPSLDQFLELRYISDDNNAWEGASETLEQCSAYFALSQLALRLGKPSDHDLFFKQSGYWKNLFNPAATPNLGYIQGRNRDGSWKEPFDPHDSGLFVEGSPLQYQWMVPFDGKGLFEKMGGGEEASRRLDAFFTKPNGDWALYREGGAYSDMSNQPSINAPWMYLFAGKAYKTQETVRATLSLLWNSKPYGIPAQDDLGEMSSWYVFSSLGIYPLYPGRADLVLGSPVFSNAVIRRKSGDFRISSEGGSADSIYVESLQVNGKKTKKSWIGSQYLEKALRLHFKMSAQPNPRFGGKGQEPPSFSK